MPAIEVSERVALAIDERLKARIYEDANEVLEAALLSLTEHEEEVNPEILTMLDVAAAGEFWDFDIDEFLAEMNAKYPDDQAVSK